MVGQRRLSKGIQKMKITRKQLRKIILKELRMTGNNDFKNIDIKGPRGPSDDEGGGPGKDWSADLIKRLHKKGYAPMGGNSTAAKVSGAFFIDVVDENEKTTRRQFKAGESMVYVEDILNNSGVVIHLHARNNHYDQHRTDEERAQYGPMMIASTKFERCDNGMDVNKIIRKVLKITRKISGMTGAMIYDDLEKLRPRSPNDENEEFDFNTILNNDEYLIDYYAR